jgi:hypothetical protein
MYIRNFTQYYKNYSQHTLINPFHHSEYTQMYNIYYCKLYYRCFVIFSLFSTNFVYTIILLHDPAQNLIFKMLII